jgi:hypothetical protein
VARISAIRMAALGLSFLLPSVASSACYVDGASARLANFCALDKIQGAIVDFRNLQLVDYKLKLEGSVRGLGLPTRVKPNSTSKVLYPIFSYSDNINGGNSPEPLVLGDLTFLGDEALYRKDGLMAGLGVGLNGRYIYDDGRYLSYGANASYAHSAEYGIGVATTGANVCSVSHISNWWYFDVCANTSRVRKDITDETNSNISLVGSKVFASSEDSYSEASFGVNRYFAESYTQYQLALGYNTIHSNGVFSAVDVMLGEAVENQLTTQLSITAQVRTQISNKPLTLSASFARADGGMLLGFERNEDTVGITASYPVWKNISASIGYKNTDSTIDYFDVSTPIFGLQLTPIQF